MGELGDVPVPVLAPQGAPTEDRDEGRTRGRCLEKPTKPRLSCSQGHREKQRMARIGWGHCQRVESQQGDRCPRLLSCEASRCHPVPHNNSLGAGLITFLFADQESKAQKD